MEKEKKPEPKSQAEPPKDFSSKLKDCTYNHGLKRNIVCNKCKSLLCPKCSINHLKEVHGIDVVPVEEAVAKPADLTVKNADEYKTRMNNIKKVQKGLRIKAGSIKNDSSLTAIRRRTIQKINDIVKRANIEKNDWSNKYLTAARGLDKLKLKYEGKLAKANEEMDPFNYKEILGKPDDPVIDNDKEEGKDADIVLKKLEEDTKAWDKAASHSDHKDEIAGCVMGLKKEVIQDLCDSVKLAVIFSIDMGNQELSKFISAKKKIIKDYEDELKRLQEIVPAMTKESQDLTEKTRKARTKLDKIVAKLKEYLKDKDDEKAAGFARCPKCKKLACNTCNAANKCEVCKKDELCKDCVADCSACNKKVCKVECMKKCDSCGKMECLTCLKDKKCVVDDLYGSTIDLNTTDKKYFYCTCPMDSYESICKFDIATQKLTNLNINVPKVAKITQIKGRIFITGGYDPTVKTVSELNEKDNTLISKADMNVARYNHSLVTISENVFCAIGGCGESDSLKDCEQYNIDENKWKALPSLNEARRYNGSIYINKTKTIYCFGGSKDGINCLNTIEKLELTGPPKSYVWKLLKIDPNEADVGEEPVLYQVSPNEIVIFRGNSSTDTYLFNTTASTIKSYDNGGKIKIIADYFGYSQKYRHQDSIYCIGNRGNACIFNPKLRECNCLAYDSIKQ